MENTYVILSTRTENEILYTTVKYNDSFIVDVAHYNPQSPEEIHQNLVNRGLSEISRMQMVERLSIVVDEIPTGVTVTF